MSESQRPSSTSHVPRYCRQKSAGRADRAFVRIDGKRIHLGTYGSKVSRARYAELITQAGTDTAQTEEVWRQLPPSSDPTVSELILAYLIYAQQYYRDASGKVSREYEQQREAMRHLRRAAGATLAREFGPRWLQEIRQTWIDQGLSKKHINGQVRRITVAFRWAVSQELIPASVYAALASVKGLRKGRSKAKESKVVRPVDAAVVEATLEKLPAVLVDMVRLQLLCGCRPGELLRMRPCDIDRDGQVWTYTPGSHKTEYHGHSRTIAIGPRGQEILLRYLARAADAVCFETRASDPRREPGVAYSTDSYRRAIQRAAKRAGAASWFPHQLRHTAATDVRAEFGLEAAQVILGHHSAHVTEVYAERDSTLAKKVALAVG